MSQATDTPPPMETVDETTDDSSLEEPDVFRVIGAFKEPAFLVTGTGNVVYGNEAALAVYRQPPDWLRSVVSAKDSRVFHRYCVSCRIEINDRILYLILLNENNDENENSHRYSCVTSQLPPSLERITKLLSMGLSDKEIAECTELTLSSVRTYTSRIYRRLGVSGRQELLAFILAEKTRDKS